MSVDLSEATKRVEVLEKFPFEDDQPNIEGPLVSVLYDSSASLDFADRGAFESRWTEELAHISALKEEIKKGDHFINMLYTYRSISKALKVKAGEESNRNETYDAMFEVLEPEIKKLKEFMYFQRDSVKFFCKHVHTLGQLVRPDKKKEVETFPSQLYLWYMIQLVDRFALLDDLKNMKACLNNDFSFYKRAHQFLRKGMSGGDDQNAENHELYLFLANQSSITTNLKAALHVIPNFDDAMSEVVNCAVKMFETDMYLLPADKHTLLRVMPYGLLLMDGTEVNSQINVFKSKKVKLSHFASIFKKYPVVPLYGDMQISLEALIRRSPHYDERAWGSAPGEEKTAIIYELIHHLDSVRTHYNEYVAKFSNMVNEIKATRKDPKMFTSTPRDVTNIVRDGLSYLSEWTGMILSQAAWKFAHPNNSENIESPAPPLDYERVVRYNYKPEEKYALIEFLAMVKTLASIMMREDSLLSPIIRTAIHTELQEHVQFHIRDPIRTTTKKKKQHFRTDLLQMRAIGADWYGGVENSNDPCLQGKKPSKDERLQLPNRVTPPSPTQLALIRNITYGLIESKKHEWKDSVNKTLEAFYVRSYFYEYLLNYSATIVSITDVGDLWYREFYLELGKKLQFPIDMSLPWILADHILETKEPSMMEF
ncbi:component of SCAR regulatory complex, partial [Planoprotostelium fungivorum]